MSAYGSAESYFILRFLFPTILLMITPYSNSEHTTTSVPISLEKAHELNENSSRFPEFPKPLKRKDFSKLTLDETELSGSRWAIEQSSKISVYHAIEIVDATLVTQSQLSLKVGFHLRQTWVADGLQFPEGLFKDYDHPNEYITADEKVLKGMWSPDSYIPTSRESNMKIASIVHIYQNKTVILNVKMFTNIVCTSNFQWYPMDSQTCVLIIESYKYDERVVRYRWTSASFYSPVQVNIERLLEYELWVPLYYDYASMPHRRRLGNNLIQVFAPTALVVVLSWFSFWLSFDADPGRISLLVTCMLTLITMHSGLKSSIPPVHYITIMDIWIITCIAFVFLEICEFVVVKYLDWMHELRQKMKEKQSRIGSPQDKLGNTNALSMLTIQRPLLWGNFPPQQVAPEEMVFGAAFGVQDDKVIKKRVRTAGPQMDGKPSSPEVVAKPKRHWFVLLDRFSRAIFPLVFLIFNCIYWPVLLLSSAFQLKDDMDE